MSLNQNFSGAAVLSGRQKLEGSDRGLDALVGLVIFFAEVLVGFLALYALYQFAVDAGAVAAGQFTVGAGAAAGALPSTIEVGFVIAVAGSILAVGISTLAYLVRLARARRSWPAPLWGLVFLSAATIVGYLVMAY